MIAYETLVSELFSRADEGYRDFHKKLLKNDALNVIGVRVPLLHKLASSLVGELDALLAFPDEYYEVTFLKCLTAGRLPFGEFVRHVDGLVSLLDNWATCDCFTSPEIRRHREEFLPYIRRYLGDGREFVVRYGLVSLLRDYVEEPYLPVIFAALSTFGSEKYYAVMGAAWLLAETLVKEYAEGVKFLREGNLKKEVLNLGIRKACESLRLTSAQKQELKSFKK